MAFAQIIKITLKHCAVASVISAFFFACSIQQVVESRDGKLVDKEDFIAYPPLPGTGTYLTVENARVRCDYKEPTESTSKDYIVTCHAVANLDGNDIKVEHIAANVVVEWMGEKTLAGISSPSDCETSDSKLVHTCKINLTTGSARMEFSLRVAEKKAAAESSKQPAIERIESAIVVFPYYVGVAAGFVPSLPLYETVEVNPSLSLTGEKPVGFQYQSFDSKSISMESSDMCATEDFVYVTDGNQIYRVAKNGMTELFAGSLNGMRDDFSNRFRIKFHPDSSPGIACSENGIYVADRLNHRIVYIDWKGEINLTAGTGDPGYLGDGGLAKDAKLNEPFALAIHPNGTLFFSDLKNYVVRKISPDGKIETIAGTGVYGTTLLPGGPAREINFKSPQRLAYDQKHDRLFIADYYGMVVWAYKNGQIERIAGSPNAGSSTNEGGKATESYVRNPLGLLVLDNGGLLIVASWGNRIFYVNKEGYITTIAGTGNNTNVYATEVIRPAQSVDMSWPKSIVKTPGGRIFFSESDGGDSSRLTELFFDQDEPKKSTLQHFLGRTTQSSDTMFTQKLQNALKFPIPYTRDIIYSPEGQIYIINNQQIRRINASGQLELVAGVNKTINEVTNSGDGGALKNAKFRYIYQAAFDQKGNLYLADAVDMPEGRLPQIRRIELDANGKISDESKISSLLSYDQTSMQLAVELRAMKFAKDGSLFTVTLYGAIGVLSANELNKPAGTMKITSFMQLGHIGGDLAFTENNEILILSDAYAKDKLLFRIPFLSGQSNLASDQAIELELEDKNIANIEVLSSGEILTSFYDDRSAGIKYLVQTENSLGPVFSTSDLITPSAGTDCGAGRLTNIVSKEKWSDEFRNSISVVCFGDILKIASHDNCASNPNGEIKLAILQEFGNRRRNIVEIIRPCEMSRK